MKNTLITSLVVSLCLQSGTTYATKISENAGLDESVIAEQLHHHYTTHCEDSSEKCFLVQRTVAVHRMLKHQAEVDLLKNSNQRLSKELQHDDHLINKEFAKNGIVKENSNEAIGEKEVRGKKVQILANEYEEEVKAWEDKNSLVHRINADAVYDYAFLSALSYSDKMFDAEESNSKELNDYRRLPVGSSSV